MVLVDAKVEATERELQPVGAEEGPLLEGVSELGTIALEVNIATDSIDKGEAPASLFSLQQLSYASRRSTAC